MKKKSELILDIDSLLENAHEKFTDEELAKLVSIREHLKRSKKLDEMFKWSVEIIKFTEVVHEILKK